MSNTTTNNTSADNTQSVQSVLDAIENIAATPGKKDKEALVRAAGEASALFLRVVRAAYDPALTYGIAAVPDRASAGRVHHGEQTAQTACAGLTLDSALVWTTLGDLAARRLTGGAARLRIERLIDELDKASSTLLRRILLRDLRAGFTDGTVNRVFPGTFPEWPYMRCSLPAKSDMAAWDWRAGVIVQEKADGMFVNVNVDASGAVSVHSRQGRAFPLECLGTLAAQIGQYLLPGTQTHGELLVYKGDQPLERQVGNGMINRVQQGGELGQGCELHLSVWDQIPLAQVLPKGRCTIPYGKRLAALVEQVAPAGDDAQIQLIQSEVVHSQTEAFAVYRAMLARGKEGVIVKRDGGHWRDGTAKDCVKLKIEADVDLRIVGFLPGTPGTRTAQTFGALLCRTACDQLEVGVSGLSDELRASIHAEREQHLGRIVTVRANAIMRATQESGLNSLFLPRLIELRSDKREADDFARVRDIFEAAAA